MSFINFDHFASPFFEDIGLGADPFDAAFELAIVLLQQNDILLLAVDSIF